VSSSSPNVMNIRRLKGIRECFVPRKGWVIIDSDYGRLELHTLAQCCLWLLGHSRLAEVLNAGRDPHSEMACMMLGITLEEGEHREDFENARDCSKISNFGFPGGLGAATLVSYAAKSYRVYITEERAQELKDYWFQMWPEMREWFNYINNLEWARGTKEYNIRQPYSDRLRAKATFCSASNTLFQGLGADVAKEAGWLIATECYVREDSPLFGCRPVNFIHDQFLVEAPEDRAALAAQRLGELMNLAGAKILPDVPVRASPVLARRWSKNAIEVRNAAGELVPWEQAA